MNADKVIHEDGSMRSFTPEVSKILINPFGFKSDHAEGMAHLERTLLDLASFFDAERSVVVAGCPDDGSGVLLLISVRKIDR